MAEWPSGWHALDGLSTLPEILSSNGYRTGLFGKYHLGTPTKPAPGWDNWVTMEDGHVRSFYHNKIFDNGKVYSHEGATVDFFTEKAIEFMGQSESQPFFAYLPYPSPYGHWPATAEDGVHRFSDLYDDCPMNSIPRCGLSPEAVRGYRMIDAGSTKGLDFSMILRAPNDLKTLRNYYAQITLIDDCVGQMVTQLEEQGQLDNTLFIFTADHGLSLGHHGFWGHGGATFPSNLHLATHSIPLIFSQPGRIQAKQVSDLHTSNLDIFATILDYLDIEHPSRNDPLNTSRSLAGVLQGEPISDWGEDEVYSEQEETRVLRTPQWVYFRRFKGHPEEDLSDALYDVQNDPQETINLIDQPEYASVAKELTARIDRFFDQYAFQEADLWRGGRPIQNVIWSDFWQQTWGKHWRPVYHR